MGGFTQKYIGTWHFSGTSMSQISKETSLEVPFSWSTHKCLLQAELRPLGGTAAGLLSAFSSTTTKLRAPATAGLSGTLCQATQKGDRFMEHQVRNGVQTFPRDQGKAVLLQWQGVGKTGGGTDKDQKTGKSEEQ